MDYRKLNQAENGTRSWVLFISLSVLCHIFFVAALVFGHLYVPKHKVRMPSVVHVDLVALPLAGPPALTPPSQKKVQPAPAKSAKFVKPVKPAPVKKTEPKIKKKTIIVKKKSVKKPLASTKKTSAKKKIKPKKSLKSKTYNAEKVVKNTRKQMKEKAEASERAHLKDTMNRFRKSVQEKPPKVAVAGTGSGARGGKKDPEAIGLYQVELYYHVQKNWAFSDRLAGGKQGLQVNLLIKIMPDGQIRDIMYETKSGNSYLDKSAYSAIVKSNPLPPLPKGYASYDIVLGFTPTGLN